MEKCLTENHVYNYLDSEELENKETAWIFYCKKCLNIRLITKSSSMKELD